MSGISSVLSIAKTAIAAQQYGASYLQPPRREGMKGAHPHTFCEYGPGPDYFKHTFFPRTIIDWRKLPEKTTSLTDIKAFRRALRASTP